MISFSLNPTVRGGLLPIIGTIVISLAAEEILFGQAKADDVSSHIYLAKPDGSELTPLPEVPGFDHQISPCWSSDGHLLAFYAYKNPEDVEAKVVVVNADGTNLRILGNGITPSFSPQAHRIAFSSTLHKDGACGS